MARIRGKGIMVTGRQGLSDAALHIMVSYEEGQGTSFMYTCQGQRYVSREGRELPRSGWQPS